VSGNGTVGGGPLAGTVQVPDVYHVTPCIIIGAGAVLWEAFESWRSSVEFWLGTSFPKAAVRWGRVREAGDATAEWADQLITPLLDIRLWLQLQEQGYVSAIPSEDALARIRVYVVYEPQGNRLDDELLRRTSEHLQTAALGRADLRHALIMLIPEEAACVAPPQGLYDETYVLSRVARGGLAVPLRLVHDVARVALHALVASQAGEIAHFLQDGVGGARGRLVGLGASAVTTAVAQMREYRTAKVFRALVTPYLGRPSVETQERLRLSGKEWAERELSHWHMPAKRLLAEHGWAPSAAPGDLMAFVPSQGHPLAGWLDDPSLEVENELTAHLMAMSSAAEARFWEEGRRRLQEALQAATRLALEPEPEPKVESEAGEQPADGPLAVARTGERAALQRTLSWLKGFEGALRGVLSPSAEGVSSVYAADEEGFRLHARSVVAECRVRHSQWERQAASTASEGALLCRCFLAWPVLAALLQTFLRYPAWAIWIAALLITATAVGVSAVLWQRRLDVLRARLREERLAGLRTLALGVLAHHARAAEKSIAEALSTIRQEVAALHDALSQEQAAGARRIAEIERDAVAQTPEEPVVEHYLYDLECCNEWVAQIIEQDVFSRSADGQMRQGTACWGVAQVVERTIRGLLWGARAAGLVHAMAAHLGAREITGQRLAAIEICDRVPTLVGGRRWEWLYRRALPLAGAGVRSKELTIVALADPSDLAGASGRTSPEWGKDWQEARSRQPHRITLLRLVPLPTDYLGSREANGEAGKVTADS